MNITWTDNLGVSDLSDICILRRVYWIKLENGQEAQVADVSVVINPFPLPGQAHYCAHHVRLSHPGVKCFSEQQAYAHAVYTAGVWMGRMITEAEKIRQAISKKRNEYMMS